MRKWLIQAIALLIVIVPILGAAGGEASAATSRVAVIKELKGTVKVKKAGGSKEFTAFAKMSLNEGDVLTVGASGSAVLQFSNGSSEDDRMSVSENSKLTFSKLSDKNGTTTKVSLWSGSAWSDVKSIKNKNDEFTLETPTAVMGVRGTHLFTVVDPISGATRVMVAAGIVAVQPGSGKQAPQLVYPAQSILLAQQDEQTEDPNSALAPVDLEEFVSSAGPAIIQAFLDAMADIQEENANLLDTYTDGQQVGQSDLERVQQNIVNLVAAIANQVRQAGKVDNSTLQRFIDEVNSKLPQQKIDLTKGELKLSEAERKLQELQRVKEQKAKELAEQKKQQELQAKNKELIEKLKQEQEKKKQEIEKALEEKKKQAFEQYEKQLSQLEKERLLRDKAARDTEQAGASPTSTAPSQSGGNPGGNPGGETFVSPLKSLTIKYTQPVSGNVSSSAAPTVEIPVSLTSSVVNQSIVDPVGMVYLHIERLDEGELAGADLKVQVNGVPVENLYYGEDYEGEPVIDFAYVDLNRAHNVIAIDVKPHGELATAANTKRITLNLSRPLLPEGSSFTTAGLEWVTTDPGYLTARSEAPLASLTVTPAFSTLSYTGATLGCEENCVGVEIVGNTIQGLSGNSTYVFKIAYTREDAEPYTVYLELMNAIPQPNWAQIFDEFFSLEDPYAETPIDLALENGVYTANVGIDAGRLSLFADIEDEYAYRGLWNEREWAYEYYEQCGEGGGFGEMQHCLELATGDNRYTLYLSSLDDLHTQAYALNVHRTELPTGVNGWSISYSTDGNETDHPMSLSLNTEAYCWSAYYCYYAHVDNELGNQVSLQMNLDGTKIRQYAVTLNEAYENYDLVEADNQTISVDLNEIADSSFLYPGIHRFYLELTDASENTSRYSITVLIGERHHPIMFTPLATNDEYTYLDARFGGDNTWYVYSPEEVQWIDFNAFNDPSTVCFAPSSGEGEGGFYLECGYVDYETGAYRYYPETSVSSFQIMMLDAITEQPYATYTVVVYNGIDIDPSVYGLTTEDFDEADPDGLSDLHYEGSFISFDENQVQAGKQLYGVYNLRGERVSPGEGGVYSFDTNGQPQYYYVVVRDEDYVMPTYVTIYGGL